MRRMRLRTGRIAAYGLAAAGLAAGSAAAQRAGDAARIDWAAGRVVATATGIADRHAPSPAVALGTSRRSAEDAARQRIAAVLGSLPLAAGGTLADRLAGAASAAGAAGTAGAASAASAAIRAQIDAAVEAAITLAAEPETDGSWRVTLAVPLEAIRIALTGPRALPPAGDRGSPIVVVDGVTARPAIGWTVAGVPAATLWIAEVPAWARDAPRVTARSARNGAIDADIGSASAATLYVIVTKH